MTLPRILVLDDLRGWSKDMRAEMCKALCLRSVGDSASSTSDDGYLAEAVFHPGQRLEGNKLVNDVEAAINEVAKGWDKSPDQRWTLVLLDLQFDEGAFEGDRPDPRRLKAWPKHPNKEFGVRILEAMASRWPDPERPGSTALPVVAMSKSPRKELEAALNNLGNLGYLETETSGGKPIATEELRQQFADHLSHCGLMQDGPRTSVNAAGNPVCSPRSPKRIVGTSRPLLYALREARQAAHANLCCLVLGPHGSGKELLAQYVHDMSTRASKPFEAVNCAAIPDTLIESELFGYAPKSGVSNAPPEGRPGKFEQADKGTIFLDEIGDMSLSAQAKILRVIQERVIQRVGARQPTKVDVLVIAATNKDLDAAAANGQFRPDLLSRLKGFVIHVPALEERREDICPLFDHFLEQQSRQIGGIWPKRVSPEVYEALCKKRWEGSVREVELTTRLVATRRRHSGEIVATDIPPDGPRLPEEPKGDPDQPQPPVPSIAGLISVLERVAVPASLEELRGKLKSLQAAYGGYVQRMIETALCQAKQTGDEYILRAMRCLLDMDVEKAREAKQSKGSAKKDSTKTLMLSGAYGKLLAAAKLFPASGTHAMSADLADALDKAKRNRRGKKKCNSSPSEGEGKEDTSGDEDADDVE